MKRGELYRVRKPPGDPKPARTYVIVSRDALIGTSHSSVICAPVFSARDGLATQVPVGAAEGLKHDSAIHCDALMSIPKARLTDYVGQMSPTKQSELDEALRQALELG